MRLRLLVILACLVGALFVAGSAQAVTDGQPDAGEHPYVGALLIPMIGGPPGLCSASLVTPGKLVTAGHCFPSTGFPPAGIPPGQYPVLVTIADPATTSSTFVPGIAFIHPGFDPGNGLPNASHDLAVVQLFGPIFTPGARYASLPAAGAVAALDKKASLTAVGYGTQGFIVGSGQPIPFPVSGQPKPRMKTSLELLTAGRAFDDYMRVSVNEGGPCYGDSGGPILDGNTVLAVASFSPNKRCAGVSYAYRLDTPAARGFLAQFGL